MPARTAPLQPTSPVTKSKSTFTYNPEPGPQLSRQQHLGLLRHNQGSAYRRTRFQQEQ